MALKKYQQKHLQEFFTRHRPSHYKSKKKKKNMKISVRFPPKPVPLAATRQVTQLWLFIEAIGNPSSLSE